MNKKESVHKRLRFYYGWIIFLVVFLIYVTMFGLRHSIGVFFTPLQQEFGWSTATTASAVTVFYWVYAVASLFVGKLYEKVGGRKAIALGGFLLGLGGSLISATHNLWQLWFFWGVLGGIGSSILYIVPTMLLSRFFEKKRGSAVGWSSIGVSVGQATMIPLAAFLIIAFGWRVTILTYGIIVVAVCSILGFILIRESPESIGLRIDGYPITPSKDSSLGSDFSVECSPDEAANWTPREALTTRSFRLIFSSYFFMIGGLTSMLTFIAPHIIRLGIDPLKAGGALGIIGVVSAFGSFLFGVVSDRKGRRVTIIMTTSGMALSFLLGALMPANLLLLYVWAVVYGLLYGGSPEQYAAIISDYFGRKHDIMLFGLITFGSGISGGLFPLVGGYLVDITGSYHLTLLFLAASLCLASLAMLPVRQVTKKSLYDKKI